MKAKAAFYFLILCQQLLSLERYRLKKGGKVKGVQVWKFSSHGFFLFFHHKASMGRW
jgi:hypothetical protein